MGFDYLRGKWNIEFPLTCFFTLLIFLNFANKSLKTYQKCERRKFQWGGVYFQENLTPQTYLWHILVASP